MLSRDFHHALKTFPEHVSLIGQVSQLVLEALDSVLVLGIGIL